MLRRIVRKATLPARHPCATDTTTQPLSSHSSHVRQSPLRRRETTPAEYAERRHRFLQHISPHSIALLPAADEYVFSHDITSPHRQDSLWYHLFGLNTPLRRQLEPPSSLYTEDVRATMAILARFKDNSTHTILCVPPVTKNAATIVWASETTPFSTFAEALAVHPQGVSSGARSTCAVMTNEVIAVCDALCSLIAQMTAQQVAYTEDKTDHSDDVDASTLTAAARTARDRAALLRLMPNLLAAYPSQLRWDGRRYRLPLTAQQRESQERLKTPTPAFHHPLEAFFSLLNARAFTMHLPRPFFDSTVQPSWGSVAFHYNAGSTYTPGLVPPHRTATTRESLLAKEIVMDALACQPPTTATARGDVRLPIRRVDPHAWSYRLVKCPSQLRQHLRSARATEHAFVHMMRSSPGAASEHDLHCALQRSVCDCSAHFGAEARVRSAYIPVIASGAHSTDIHYTDNCAEAAAGDVMRVDAGVEVENVPTDCTRTFPIGSPAFALPQLVQLYDGVLELQRTLLRLIAPGVAVGEVARRHLDETRALLCSLGVDVRREDAATPAQTPHLSSAAEEEEQRERQLPMSLVRSCFCAHSFGHLFGIDIHEEWGTTLASTAKPHIFEGGMMHTVEPGIYIPSLARASLFGLTAAQLPSAFHRGVGVQVEDDVFVLPPSSTAESRRNESSQEPSPCCPWSRGVYLQHALAAFARYFGTATESRGDGDYSSLHSPSLAVLSLREYVRALLSANSIASAPSTPHVWNVVNFLFSQRVALYGLEAAAAAIASDVDIATQLSFVKSPAYEAAASVLVPGAANTEWYPFSIIVLTATVPKDRQWIESTLQVPPMCCAPRPR